jgi:hypothetical protein
MGGTSELGLIQLVRYVLIWGMVALAVWLVVLAAVLFWKFEYLRRMDADA